MEMNNNKLLDGVMLDLLTCALPFPLGIPAWVLQEMRERPVCPVDPKQLPGLSGAGMESDLLSEYDGAVGYQFSWGALFEETCIFDEISGEKSLLFSLSPDRILKQLPDRALVENLFLTTYCAHPKADGFDVSDAAGTRCVMTFLAIGRHHMDDLRKWMVTTFIPEVLPDLLRKAESIVNLARQGGSLV
jgi:hypothetical protein